MLVPGPDIRPHEIVQEQPESALEGEDGGKQGAPHSPVPLEWPRRGSVTVPGVCGPRGIPARYRYDHPVLSLYGHLFPFWCSHEPSSLDRRAGEAGRSRNALV